MMRAFPLLLIALVIMLILPQLVSWHSSGSSLNESLPETDTERDAKQSPVWLWLAMCLSCVLVATMTGSWRIWRPHLAQDQLIESKEQPDPPGHCSSPKERELSAAILDTIEALVVVLDAQGRILRFNRACEATTGYTAEEAHGLHFWDVLLPFEEIDRVRKAFRELCAKGSGTKFENHWRTRTGELRLIQWSNAVLYDEAEEAESVVATGIDVTEQRAAQSQLRKISSAVEQNPATVMIADTNGRIEYVNPKFTQLTGYASAEVLGRNPSLLKSGAQSPEFYEELWNTITSGTTWRGEFCNAKKDGELYWESASISPVRDAEDTITHFVAVKEDITERKQVEEALRESEAKFRAMSESAHDAIIMICSDGSVTYWNKAAERMFGYSTDDMLGKEMHTLLVPMDYREASTRGLNAFAESGQGAAVDQTLELTALRRDGSEFPVELSVSSVRLQGEWHAIGIVRDISERKRAEHDLLDAKEAAEAANRAKSEFLANMSHEIRTPMNGIIGMAELTLDTELTEEQREYLEMARSSADSLLTLLNDILDFSKIEAGKLEFEAQLFGPRERLDEIVRFMTFRAREKGLELTSTVDSAVPGQLVGDPARLGQVVLNLASNAIKFTEEGCIKIECRVDQETICQDNECVLHFSVTDTGIGISPEEQLIVFESFRQADSSMTRKYGGTGLGLAIASQLVSLMGGKLWLESPAPRHTNSDQVGGPGCVFHFTVCLVHPDSVGIKSDLPSQLPEDVVVEDAYELPLLRILLAEDNHVNQRLAIGLLRKMGHTVLTATTGREAIEVWEDQPIDLILMDVQMPEMDGFEATGWIRQQENDRDHSTPIVAMTAHTMKGDRERCLATGMNAYVPKPLRKAELIRAMKDGLAAAEGETA